MSIENDPASPRYDDWEDDETTTDERRPKSPSRLRKRRDVRRRVQLGTLSPARPVVVSPRKKATLPSQTQEAFPPRPPDPPETPQLARHLHSLLYFTGEILVGSLKLLKFPFTIVVAAYMLSLLATRAYLAVTSPITSIVEGLCNVPGISLLGGGLSICDRPNAPGPRQTMRPDYPRLMEIETTSFEKLLDNSLSNSDLVLNLKKAEMASADLNTLLMVSDLTIKTQLSTAVGAFVNEARIAGRSLQRFDAKIQGTIDQVVAFNEYILRMSEGSRGRLVSGSAKVLRTALFLPSKEKEQMGFMFDQIMNMLESHLARLLTEAQGILSQLDGLEEKLGGIHMLISTETATIGKRQSDLLGELWTVLGGNRRQLKKYERHSELLSNIDLSRQRALAHVVAAVTTLEATQASLEELRERASTPGLVGFDIPIEAQVLSVRSAMERLTLSRDQVRASKTQIGTLQ